MTQVFQHKLAKQVQRQKQPLDNDVNLKCSVGRRSPSSDRLAGLPGSQYRDKKNLGKIIMQWLVKN